MTQVTWRRIFTIGLLTASVLSCHRSENAATKTSVLTPVPMTDPDDGDTDTDPGFSGPINEDNTNYLKNIEDLAQGHSSEIHFAVVNRRALGQITSKAWSYADHYAMNGKAVSADIISSDDTRTYCHFVDKVRDFGEHRRASDYSLLEVEANSYGRNHNLRYALYLTAEKDRHSKFIYCSVGPNQKLTGLELQKAFGNNLGLVIYIK